MWKMQQNFGSRSGKKKHKTNDGGSSLIGDKTFFYFLIPPLKILVCLCIPFSYIITTSHLSGLTQHAEHEGKPYCNNPCYSALFGPGGKRIQNKTNPTPPFFKSRLKVRQQTQPAIHQNNHQVAQKVPFFLLCPLYFFVNGCIFFFPRTFIPIHKTKQNTAGCQTDIYASHSSWMEIGEAGYYVYVEKKKTWIYFFCTKGRSRFKISILKNIEKKKSFEIRETNLLGTN